MIRGRDGKRKLEWRNTAAVFGAVGVYHLLGGMKLLGPQYALVAVVPWAVWAAMNAIAVLATRAMKQPKQLGPKVVAVMAATLAFAAVGHMTAQYPYWAPLRNMLKMFAGLVWPF